MALRRAAWTAMPGDCWRDVSTARQAVRALGKRPRRVFVALGRSELGPLTAAPQHHYLIRSVDPVEPPLSLPHISDCNRSRPLRRSRRPRAHVYPRGGGADRKEQRRHRELRQDRRRPRARHRGHHAAPGPPLPDAPAVASVDEAIVWLDHARRPRRRGARRVNERRTARADDCSRFARADDDERRHVSLCRLCRFERDDAHVLVGASDRAAEDDRRSRRQMLPQPPQRGRKLPRPCARHRIVKRTTKPALAAASSRRSTNSTI